MPLGPLVGALIVGSCAVCWKMMGQSSQKIAEEVAVAVACAACGAGAINEVGNRVANIEKLRNANQHPVQQQTAPAQQKQLVPPGQQQVPGRGAGFVICVLRSGRKISVM